VTLLKTYHFRSGGSLLSHDTRQVGLVRDEADDQGTTYLGALVASDKCLFTLATELDEATRLLATKPDTARSRIERISRTLQELQRDYQLVRRAAARRR
jgi:hypothetical protein